MASDRWWRSASSRSDAARRLGLLPAPFAHARQLALDDGEPVLDERRQPARVQRELVEMKAMLLGLGPLRRVTRQPLVDLGEAARQLGSPRLVLRGMHLEIAAQGGHGIAPLLEPPARRPDAFDARRARRLLRGQRGERLLQLDHARRLALEALGQLGLMGGHRARLDRHVAPLIVDLLHLGAERREPAVVGVERARPRPSPPVAASSSTWAAANRPSAASNAAAASAARERASSSAARVTPGPDAPTRLPDALNRSPSVVTATAPG